MPRHSTGCLTCVSRRVKCDEARPSCQRCAKAGVVCKGYPESFRFVDERKRVERRRDVEGRQGEELAVAVTRRNGGKGKELYHSGQLIRIKVVEELSLVAFKEEILIRYLTDKVFQGRSGKGTKTWIQDIGGLSKPSPSLQALAKLVFGNGHHSSQMVGEARSSYGLALKELRIKLLDSSENRNLNVLASVTALCMYEILDRRMERAWAYHADGLGSLMETRGPLHYQNYLEKSFFHDQRVILVSKAIFSGHKTFLSQPAWKTVPWQNDLSSKEPLDHLIDILCDVADYLAEIKTHPAGMTPVQILELKQRAVASMSELDAWWRDWIKKNPEPCKDTPVHIQSTVSGDEIQPVFSTFLQYDSLFTAYTLTTYDATRILLLQILQEVSKAESQFRSSITNINSPRPVQDYKSPLLGITWSTNDLAHEIFRSIEYCHQQSQQFMCTFVCLFVLDVAYSSLDPSSREVEWLFKRMGLPTKEMTRSNASLEIKVLSTCQLTTAE